MKGYAKRNGGGCGVRQSAQITKSPKMWEKAESNEVWEKQRRQAGETAHGRDETGKPTGADVAYEWKGPRRLRA